MASINDSLSPDLLFNVFKRLNCIETTRVRRVCKQWFEIIDEHKSFWRTLHLPKKSVNWDSSILQLFVRKSGSTLQDVEIDVGVGREHQEQIFDTLKKSKASLKHLFLRLRTLDGLFSQEIFECFTAMESLRLLKRWESYQVCLRRRPNRRDSGEEGSNAASSLRVLWCRDDLALLQINRDRLKNLVSLDTAVVLSSSQWRDFLEGPSKILKHLRFGFEGRKNEDQTSSLEFPNLEVLELTHGRRVPQWLLIPDTVKLVAHSGIYDLPSISELWTWDPTSQGSDIIDRLPKLKTCLPSHGPNMGDVLGILKQRRGNVEAGLQVNGVKMEMIKTLILPYNFSNPDLSDELKEGFRRCRELVEVVEEEAQFRLIEVEY